MTETTGKIGPASQFEELPDAPPRRRLQLSWSGKLGVCVVVFWAVIVAIGPTISPYHEADILDEALFIVPGSDELYPETDFQPPSRVVWLGSDYLGRDTLSRTLFGARTTIGISLASTLLAYLVGVTLGIAAAVGGVVLDSALSRINDAFLSMPTIMLALVVIAAIGSTIPILILLTGLIYATSVFRIRPRAGVGRDGQRLRRGRPGAGRGPVVDHHPRDPAQRGPCRWPPTSDCASSTSSCSSPA